MIFCHIIHITPPIKDHSSFNINHNLSEELSVAEIKSMMEEKNSVRSSVYTQIDI